MSTRVFVVLGLTVWALTLFTYILGYQAGKTSGYALGRSGGKLDDDDNGMRTSGTSSK